MGGLGPLLLLASCASAGDRGSGGAQTLGSNDTTGDSGMSASTASTAWMQSTESSSGDSGLDTTGAGDSSTTSGAPETTDSDSSGSDDTSSPAVSWNRYTLDVRGGTWSTTPLDQLWQGANAPPATDIEAAMSLTHFDRLWVVTSDGMFYEQSDGVWQAPVPLAMRFPMTAGLDIGAMTHTPSADDTTSESVFFVDNPVAVIYTQHENGGLDLVEVAMLEDQADGAPQGSGRALWYVPIIDPLLAGMDEDWLQWFVAYDDGNLWRFNAAFVWTSAPLGNNQFLTGGLGEPDPDTIAAAYYDDVFERAHFIAP